MDPRLSGIIMIKKFKISESELYPKGEYFVIEFTKFNRKEEPLPKIVVSTEKADSVLNYLEEYMETGTLREVSL